MLAEQFDHLLFLILFDERWKDVPGFGNYEASTHGRVRNVRGRSSKGRILKPCAFGSQPGKRMHLGYNLCRNGKGKTVLAHRVILDTFVGPCPDGLEGCHGDGDGTNNHLYNLRWDTHLANMADRKLHGNHPSGAKNPKAKLTEEGVLEMRRLESEGHSRDSLANRFGVEKSLVGQIVRRETWLHI